MVRIVSLLPSTTEILFALGAGDEVVGVTFECNFPPQARSRRIVSTSTLGEGLSPRQIDAEVRARLASGEDLYHLDEGALRDLAPDLVLTQDLICAVSARSTSPPSKPLLHTWAATERALTVDPATLAEVFDSIVAIGVAIGRSESAGLLVANLRARPDRDQLSALADEPRSWVAVLEWTDPLFSAGHSVPDMVKAAGATSVVGAAGRRSEQISPDTLRRLRSRRSRGCTLRLRPGRGGQSGHATRQPRHPALHRPDIGR